MSGHSAASNSEIRCDAGAPNLSYSNYLKDNVGVILDEYDVSNASPCSDCSPLNHGYQACQGISVHTFLYINVGGTGKSDTSGSVTC